MNDAGSSILDQALRKHSVTPIISAAEYVRLNWDTIQSSRAKPKAIAAAVSDLLARNVTVENINVIMSRIRRANTKAPRDKQSAVDPNVPAKAQAGGVQVVPQPKDSAPANRSEHQPQPSSKSPAGMTRYRA